MVVDVVHLGQGRFGRGVAGGGDESRGCGAMALLSTSFLTGRNKLPEWRKAPAGCRSGHAGFAGFYAALAVLASALGCGLLMGIERERRKGSGPHRAWRCARSRWPACRGRQRRCRVRWPCWGWCRVCGRAGRGGLCPRPLGKPGRCHRNRPAAGLPDWRAVRQRPPAGRRPWR